MTTTAKIAAKGCKNTGLTEQIAAELHDNLGRTIIAVVELTADARTENRDGDEAVKLTIGMIEVAPDTMTADHLRELARSFHYERRLAEDGPTLTDGADGPEPKVADVLAAGARHKPHPFLPDDASSEQPICDVCGNLEPAGVHSVQELLPDADHDEYDEDGDDDQADDVDESVEPCELLDGDEHPDTTTDRSPHLTPVPDPFTSPGTPA